MKRILSLVSVLFICSDFWAQESGFIIGIDLTASTSNFWGDFNRNSATSFRGIYPGINMEYVLHEHFSVKSGIAFEKKGISYDLVVSNVSLTEQWNIHHALYYEYISIPVLISYSTRGKVKFYLNGGFFGGFLVKHMSEYYSERDNTTEIKELEDGSKKYDAGISFGAGGSIAIGKRICLDLGVRDNLGLINLYSTESAMAESIRTNSLALVLAFKLKI